MTAHLAGGSSITDYQTVHNRRWHHFHVFQSGHAKNTAGINPWEDRYEFAVRRARTFPEILYLTTTSGTSPACPNFPAISLPAPTSVKPETNGEAAYDEVYVSPTYTQLNSQQVDTPQGVRQTGYSSTLNSSFGFTLGVKGIYNWTDISSTPLNSEGSQQMKILGDQFRLLPWETLQRRSSLIKKQPTDAQDPTKPEEDKQVVMSATSDNGFAMLYLPDNTQVKVDLSLFTGYDCTATGWSTVWTNPRTGNPPTTNEVPQCTKLTGDPDGATHRFSRPSCTNPLFGDSGQCDWIVKLQRGGTKALTSQPSSLAVWSEPTEDGSGWRIMGRLRGQGEAPGTPFAISEPRNGDGYLRLPVMAQEPQGSFFVAWEDDFDGDFHGIFLRRLDGQGRLLDHEYPVNRTIKYDQTNPWAAAGPAGAVITWTSYAQDGDLGGIFARMVNPAGAPFGQEIPVNQFAAGHQDFSKVGIDLQGNFVVAWTSEGQDGDAQGVYARRFDRNGNPLGGEFEVNLSTAGAQFLTDLEVGPFGDFLVTWTSYAPDGSDLGVWGRRFDAQGSPLSGEFLIVSPPAPE